MRVALVQINAGPDKKANMSRAEDMVREALDNRAQFVLLPEVFSWRGNLRDAQARGAAQEAVPGETTEAFSGLARRHKAHILLGSLFERIPGSVKAHNTSVLLAADGKIAAKYRKINLFDARINGKIVREADCLVPGKRTSMARVNGYLVGLSICYDLRFPEIYRAYGRAGADILTVPSCFTKTTGQAHWELLLRARAVENLSFVLAPNQVGRDARGIETYGNSMIISPWGEIIAKGSGTREEIVYGRIDRKALERARSVLPGIRGG